LIEEAEEVRKELKEGNRVHLEDELGDVLRVYLNLLEILEHE
jgi:NTP pyrophosphatase (non-canonical NTP hydrolase)